MKEDKEIRPYTPVVRPCPWHGFDVLYNILIKDCKSRYIMRDTGGNQCALAMILANPYSLCDMMRDKPNWFKCSLNTEENRKKIAGNLEKIRVFPKEHCPTKGKEWDGIPLEIWVKWLRNTTSIEE